MPTNPYHDRRWQWAAYAVFFAILAMLPLFVSNTFVINQLGRYCVFGLLAASVCLVWGYGGILSLGQGIAFGLAAYGMAMTMQLQSQDPVNNPVPSFMLSNELEVLPSLWEPFWSTPWGLTLALLVPVVFFVFLGLLMFQARVAGVFVAIMTLAVLSAWYSMVYDMQPYTGGFSGITPPAPLKLGALVIDPYTPLAYWIVLAVLAIVTVGCKLLLGSRFGLVVEAIRGDPERARFLGYSVAFYQVVIFALSGLIAALAGVCWVMLVQYVSPTSMELTFSISMVIWAAVGGRMSLLGSILGAFLVNGMQSYLGDQLLYLFLLVLGMVFIVIVRYFPDGIAGLWEKWLGRVSGRRRTRKAAPEGSAIAGSRPSPAEGG